MNDLEKKSFYSFVGLYLLSSLFFVLFSGYWYFDAQKKTIENETYYKLTHIADKISAQIISAQMKGTTLELPNEEWFEYSLISTDDAKGYEAGYTQKDGYTVLVSSSPQEHLSIEYVVVKSKIYFTKLAALKKEVFLALGSSFMLMFIISIALSKLFMQPIRTRIQQIESFIQDVTHELNTPITALKMSASRGIQKAVYDKNILRNISISTKQLESIYKSLTFLNFKQKTQKNQTINLKILVENSIEYHKELTDAKQITIVSSLQDKEFSIIPLRAELLFSNLLSNAIKYSLPNTTITIVLNEEFFSITDQGVGIQKDKLNDIFKLYKRESNLAGGFGVGLSIVKQICDEYHINIDVDSTLGKGSSFKLSFRYN